MNRAFDQNGVLVSPSKPVKNLQLKKKTFSINSADRDTVKYYTNGDIVVYLPRVYENVVSLRLQAAEFPPLIPSGLPNATTAAARAHYYVNGQNTRTGFSATDVYIGINEYSFFIDIEGLNKTDECAVGAQSSGYPDGYFAKIPVSINANGIIDYNDKSAQDNISRFYPAIGKLDRLHIRTRLHSQQGNQGFIYWTTDGNPATTSGSNQKGAEFSLSFEIEYLDNSFDDFSQFETRIATRA
jgi:hypothetical protein